MLPDVNVLLALTVEPHPSHEAAQEWFHSSGVDELFVCRVSQLGLMRLLTTRSAMEDQVLTNEQAWALWDRMKASEIYRIVDEPIGIEKTFRVRSELRNASPKRWTDAYLSAFSHASSLPLVTFDKTLAGYTPRSILLRT